ncbi:MAG: hypothetical protein ACO1N3_01480 [Gammaproteobacteria bacterium]
MSNNQRKEPGKPNQNIPKRPFDQHQKERINPNQRPQEGGFNREAAGNDWKRPEQRPNQGGKGNQGGRHQPGQGGHKGGNLGNNYGREDRR